MIAKQHAQSFVKSYVTHHDMKLRRSVCSASVNSGDKLLNTACSAVISQLSAIMPSSSNRVGSLDNAA